MTKGTTEPYRLLTSRAEYRLLLRHDNAELRLTELGRKIGLVKDEQYQHFLAYKESVQKEVERLETTRLRPSKDLQAFLKEKGSALLQDGILAADLLRRPELSIEDIWQFSQPDGDYDRRIKEEVAIQIKYAGYIEKAEKQVMRLRKMEGKLIPETIDYDKVEGLATEAKDRLKKIQPRTLAQASRVSGVLSLIHI